MCLSAAVSLLFGISQAGCGDEAEFDHCEPREGALVDPAGSEYRYVVSAIELPASSNRAREMALQLDEDDNGRGDNQLGHVFAAFGQFSEYDLSGEANALVASGELLQLIDVETRSLEDAGGVGVQVSLGQDLDDDPSDNHSGSEPLSLDRSVEAGLMSGTVADGQLIVELGTAPLALTFPGFGERFIFPLTGARMEATITEDGIIGSIGGAVSVENLNTQVVPALLEGFRRAIARDCSTGQCEEESFGLLLVEVFDDNDPFDYVITEEELRNSSLFDAFFAPDMDLYDEEGNYAPGCDSVDESLSITVGFAAVRADFGG
jgi:hypothetical protein